VIHACHTNEMPSMGGLLRKMPWTAGTMLVGCLAIAGAGIPLVVGLSGYYSKDALLAQLWSFNTNTPAYGWLFYVALGGAGVTSFYMFRLWFMTFLGQPRDKHVYEHAHESPASMVAPLVLLAVLAVAAGWGSQYGLSLTGILEQARPLGTDAGLSDGRLIESLVMPAESASHAKAIHVPVTLAAFGSALVGFLLAAAFYWRGLLDPEAFRRGFAPIHSFLRNKWWFDELYGALFVRPTHFIARLAAGIDRNLIDWLADGSARVVQWFSGLDELIDRYLVDGLVNAIARWTHAIGLGLRRVQTGNLRQYVMFLVVGTVALFVAVVYWNYAVAGL
jgi:NADH:ubiquinone oxidoreductase subunit 5 (subunit L)/multisubunit Na+/H+ antiporter MnhA subunit